jgi:hypothetical protein
MSTSSQGDHQGLTSLVLDDVAERAPSSLASRRASLASLEPLSVWILYLRPRLGVHSRQKPGGVSKKTKPMRVRQSSVEERLGQ